MTPAETDDSKNKVDTSTEVRARIEQSLNTRSAPSGTVSARVEHGAKLAGAKLWEQLKRRPSLGVAMVGLGGVALATAVGVGELTIGIVAGYAAYQVLREGVAPMTAARGIVQAFEKLA